MHRLPLLHGRLPLRRSAVRIEQLPDAGDRQLSIPRRPSIVPGPSHLLPEALPGILNSIIITLVTLVNYSAMAGAIGGGGLGDVGIRYGYQRFDPTVMLVTVVILVVLVQLIQSAGERLVKQCDHR